MNPEFFQFIVQRVIQSNPHYKRNEEAGIPTIPPDSFLQDLKDDPDGLAKALMETQALYKELGLYMYLEERDHPQSKGEIEINLVSDTHTFVGLLKSQFAKEIASLDPAEELVDSRS